MIRTITLSVTKRAEPTNCCEEKNGFLPQLFALRAVGVRDRQTLAGNGWPRSYGQWLARSYALTERRSFV